MNINLCYKHVSGPLAEGKSAANSKSKPSKRVDRPRAVKATGQTKVN